MSLRKGDLVYIAASGFSNSEENLATGYILRVEEYEGRNHAWVAITSKIPTTRLWGSFRMNLYHTSNKTPLAKGTNYNEYDFTDDQLFYLVPLLTVKKYDEAPLIGDDLTRMDNKLEVSVKLNLKKEKQHRKYVKALANYLHNLDNPQPIVNNHPPNAPVNNEYPIHIAAAPFAEEENEPRNYNSNENPQGGFRLKSKRKTKKSKNLKKKQKITRKD